MSVDPLERQILKLSGIAPLLGHGVLERARRKANLKDSERLQRINIPKLLPHLRVALLAYLGPTETERRLAAIEALSSSAIETVAYRLDDESLDET